MKLIRGTDTPDSEPKHVQWILVHTGRQAYCSFINVLQIFGKKLT